MDEAKDSKDNLMLGRINMDLGEINNVQKDYALSRKRFQNAYYFFSKDKLQELAYHSLLFIGESYHDAKDYETAKKYYRQIFSKAKDSLQIGFSYQDIGLNFYDSKQYDSAYFYFKKIINYPYIKNNKALRYLYLSNIYFEFNKFDSAIYFASNALRFNPDIHTQRECYRAMTNIEFALNRIDNVTIYMNKYVKLGDSIRKIDNQTKGSYIETMHNNAKEMVLTKNKMSYLYFLLALIIILSATAFFMIRKRNKKEKQDTVQLHLQQKATMHKGTIVNHREVLQNKIKERKAMLASERKKANPAGKIEIDRKVYEELLHINDTEYFYDEMNSVLNNLVNKLNKLYPTLTPREVKWCCLSLLQIPSTDMYLLLDTNVDSLKKMKQRLAPKFNLTLVSELEDFLFNLISE